MKPKGELYTYKREGFTAVAIEHQDYSVTVTADADIDADGANGQNGGRAAYMVNNMGSELLGNGGMGMRDGRVVGITDWYQDIVILNVNKQPEEFPGRIIASKTAYRWAGKDENDPAAYVDSETIPYVCVPPEIRKFATKVVMGCKVMCRYKLTGRVAWGMVADVGPRNKVGEISIQMARLLGIDPSPRNGGEEKALVEYTFFPGEYAEIQNGLVPLLSIRGEYIFPPNLGSLTRI